MFIKISGASGSLQQPQEYGHPLKGSIYLYPTAFRIVRGLHCCSPDPGTLKYHLHVASSLSLAPLVGRGRPSTTTPRGRLPYWTEKPVGASRFPSSLGEGSPRKRIVEEDCMLSCKIYIPGIIRKEQDTFKTALFTYDLA